MIVEVEAYIGEEDPACHAAPGRTRRNAPLYGPPGIAYVYLNYGIHYLVNAVTEAEGWPAAVLIRALEPKDGIALMRKRRAAVPRRIRRTWPSNDLCRGPGNLTKALGIDLRQNLLDLTASALRIEDQRMPKRPVAWSRRIGINVGGRAGVARDCDRQSRGVRTAVQGRSTWRWQYSQSALMVEPSFAVFEPSWQRKQPGDAMCPVLSGYRPQVTFIAGNTFRR